MSGLLLVLLGTVTAPYSRTLQATRENDSRARTLSFRALTGCDVPYFIKGIVGKLRTRSRRHASGPSTCSTT